jgi:hypothetical protein
MGQVNNLSFLLATHSPTLIGARDDLKRSLDVLGRELQLSDYVNAQAFMADVRLRLDALGPESTVLVVEGNDDKRLFITRVIPTSDVVPASGKTLLRSALESIRGTDKGRVLFLTDCDYDVAAGTLHGGPDVVITKSCDVESDLIGLGVLAKVAVEVVPQAISSKDSAIKIEIDVRQHAQRMALPFGRIRMAAQPFGVDLNFDEVDFSKYWDVDSKKVLEEKVYRVMWSHLGEAGIDRGEWDERIREIPDDVVLCHGKDLVKASQMFFRYLYKMDNKVSKDFLAMMLRLAVDQKAFESWDVVKRIRKWEARYGFAMLAPYP